MSRTDFYYYLLHTVPLVVKPSCARIIYTPYMQCMFFHRVLFKRRTSPFTIRAVIIIIIRCSRLYIYILYTLHVTPPPPPLQRDDRTAGAREKYDYRVNAVALILSLYTHIRGARKRRS